MRVYGTKLFWASVVFTLAFSAGAQESAPGGHAQNLETQSGDPDKKKPRSESDQSNGDLEKDARKKSINEAADSDRMQPEGREKLSKAANDFWSGLTASEQKDLETSLGTGDSEKIDALLKEQGLVLSSPEKRSEFLRDFRSQLEANLKLRTYQGLTELIATAKSDAKGDASANQKILSAKKALSEAIKEQQPVVDFLAKNFGWSPESALSALKGVEEQGRLLKSGTPQQQGAAVKYLMSVFLPIYSASLDKKTGGPSKTLNELFQDPKIRETDFGKTARAFVTAGLGENFKSKESGKGQCAGVECTRDFIAGALVRSAISPGAQTAKDAFDAYNKNGRFPSHIKTPDGQTVPLLSDEGVKAMTEKFNDPETAWLFNEQESYRIKYGLGSHTKVEERLSLQNEAQLKALVNEKKVQENNGASLYLVRKEPIPSADGKSLPQDIKHAVTLTQVGVGADKVLAVRDPNFKGLAFDVKVDPTDPKGRFSYSYIRPDGSKQILNWDNFYPSPTYWPQDSAAKPETSPSEESKYVPPPGPAAQHAKLKSEAFAYKAEEYRKKAEAPETSTTDSNKYAQEEKAALSLKQIHDRQFNSTQNALAANLNAVKHLGSAAGSALRDYQSEGTLGVAKSIVSGAATPNVLAAARSVGNAFSQTRQAAAANTAVSEAKTFSDYFENGIFKASSGETIIVPEGNRAAYSATSQDGKATADEMRIGTKAISIQTSDNAIFNYAGVQNGRHVWGGTSGAGLTYNGPTYDKEGSSGFTKIPYLHGIQTEPVDVVSEHGNLDDSQVKHSPNDSLGEQPLADDAEHHAHNH